MSTTEEKADRQQEQKDKAQREARRQEECARLEAVIAAGVLRGLGRPADFLRAGARPLWGNYYRVNVFAGPDAASARIAHSFFLETDGEGHILTSDPPVTRAY
jgi:hypothetical protein